MKGKSQRVHRDPVTAEQEEQEFYVKDKNGKMILWNRELNRPLSEEEEKEIEFQMNANKWNNPTHGIPAKYKDMSKDRLLLHVKHALVTHIASPSLMTNMILGYAIKVDQELQEVKRELQELRKEIYKNSEHQSLPNDQSYLEEVPNDI